ncbi:MAG: glycosyltransferase family 4 protein [Candidatus Andersenbacteria bacterium]
MKVIFIGQLGVRVGSPGQKTPREERIINLGRALAQRGHRVTVVTTKPYSNPTLRNYYGITFVPKASFDREYPGGWLYVILSLLTLWRQQPDVAHLHGWRTASLAWLAALLSPETTFIWTVDALPQHFPLAARLVARQAGRVCDVMTTPTRTLQYLLLQHYNLRAAYIPDGYTRQLLKDIPLASLGLGLRKEQYCLLLASEVTTIRAALRAYATTKSRKKLVIVAEPTAAWERLINRKSFVHFIGKKYGRQLRTLVRQAACVIATEDTPNLEVLLQAMDSGRSIIAANISLYQELLGVTAQFYRSKRRNELSGLLQATIKRRSFQRAWGATARQRARHHFTWERVLPEYLAAYRYREVVVVPLDSVQLVALPRPVRVQ